MASVCYKPLRCSFEDRITFEVSLVDKNHCLKNHYDIGLNIGVDKPRARKLETLVQSTLPALLCSLSWLNQVSDHVSTQLHFFVGEGIYSKQCRLWNQLVLSLHTLVYSVITDFERRYSQPIFSSPHHLFCLSMGKPRLV